MIVGKLNYWKSVESDTINGEYHLKGVGCNKGFTIEHDLEKPFFDSKYDENTLRTQLECSASSLLDFLESEFYPLLYPHNDEYCSEVSIEVVIQCIQKRLQDQKLFAVIFEDDDSQNKFYLADNIEQVAHMFDTQTPDIIDKAVVQTLAVIRLKYPYLFNNFPQLS